jgi:hypothetical protein
MPANPQSNVAILPPQNGGTEPNAALKDIKSRFAAVARARRNRAAAKSSAAAGTRPSWTRSSPTNLYQDSLIMTRVPRTASRSM